MSELCFTRAGMGGVMVVVMEVRGRDRSGTCCSCGVMARVGLLILYHVGPDKL